MASAGSGIEKTCDEGVATFVIGTRGLFLPKEIKRLNKSRTGRLQLLGSSEMAAMQYPLRDYFCAEFVRILTTSFHKKIQKVQKVQKDEKKSEKGEEIFSPYLDVYFAGSL